MITDQQLFYSDYIIDLLMKYSTPGQVIKVNSPFIGWHGDSLWGIWVETHCYWYGNYTFQSRNNKVYAQVDNIFYCEQEIPLKMLLQFLQTVKQPGQILYIYQVLVNSQQKIMYFRCAVQDKQHYRG